MLPVLLPSLSLLRQVDGAGVYEDNDDGGGNTLCHEIAGEHDEQSPEFAVWRSVIASVTNFVTIDILDNKNTVSQMRIVQAVYDQFLPIVEGFRMEMGLQKRHIRFVYKGGNVMRFAIHSLAIDNPHIFGAIHAEYFEDFQASDIDFGIYLTQGAPYVPSSKVHALTRQCEKAMKDLRDIFVRSPATMTGLRSSKQVLVNSLKRTFLNIQKKVREYNATTSQNKVEVPDSLRCMDVSTGNSTVYQLQPSVTRHDFAVVLYEGIPTTTGVEKLICESRRPPQMLYVSRNETLKFESPRGDVRHFDLVRMKLSFDLGFGNEVRQKIGGEVVDLSISHQDSVDTAPYAFLRFSTDRYANVYQTYEVQTPQRRYSVESYSVAGLACDTIRVLFEFPNFPWDDRKYGKRLKRTMGLLLCEAFLELADGAPFATITDAMRRCVRPETGELQSNTIWAFLQQHVARIKALPDSEDKNYLVATLEHLSDANVSMLISKKTTAPRMYVQTVTNS
ncbi:hypothetical protein N9S30_00660 [bacterium]|nr:hypothetical protein [bacterium]